MNTESPSPARSRKTAARSVPCSNMFQPLPPNLTQTRIQDIEELVQVSCVAASGSVRQQSLPWPGIISRYISRKVHSPRHHLS
jgi:hypothetical protein